MGATTLYHPISLHVIRGAAAYGGFEFGKIKQLKADQEAGSAVYCASIQKVPAGLIDALDWRIWASLSGCFMDDISVARLFHSTSGVLTCWLAVQIKQGQEQAEEEAVAE